MKKLFLTLLVAFVATTALKASNTITYTADAKLQETYSSSSGLHTNAFNTNISSHTFNNGIGTITFYGEVTTIKDNAFGGCSGLTSITIPNSVTSIENKAFWGCTSLISVTLNSNAIVSKTYTSSNNIKTIFGTQVIEYILGDSVATIGNGAFQYCSGLTSVTIPNSVTTIGDKAFDGCSGLTAVTIPNSVTSIGKRAFYNCSGLTSITIPNSVTAIGDEAFSYCSDLTSITIPNSVTTIGLSAFFLVNNIVYSGTATSSPWGAKCMNGYVDGYLVYSDATKTMLCGCSSAATGIITIPNSVTAIGDYTFGDCSGLTSVTIPNSVTTIGEWAFYGCGGLTAITIPNSVTTIGNYAFSGCAFYYPVYNAHCFACMPQFSSQSSQGAYTYTIPNGITQIVGGAFFGCSGLTSVTIPNSVTTIGEKAFGYCKDLTSIIIPNSVTTIGDYAFQYCSELHSIICYATNPPIVGEYTFDGINQYTKTYVLASSWQDYQFAVGWRNMNLWPIGGIKTSITKDEVIVTSETNQATFTWPQNNQADSYLLEITKDGVVFCTLTFNAIGQLTSIAFAPSRSEARTMPAATMTSAGWQFTVTGLNQASKYTYTLDVKNASQKSIKTYTGEFATDGYTDLLSLPYEGKAGIGSVKFIKDGRLFIERNGIRYNAHGARVK